MSAPKQKPVPNFRSETPPAEPYRTIERAIMKVLHTKGETLRDKRKVYDEFDLLSECLSQNAIIKAQAVWDAIPFTTEEERKAALRNVAALASGVARNVLFDRWSERERLRKALRERLIDWAFPADDGSRKVGKVGSDSKSHAVRIPIRNPIAIEDAAVASLDRLRGRRALTTDFDRALFWDELHAWCAGRYRQRFARSWTMNGVPFTRQALAKVCIDGNLLSPEEATWTRLLSMPECPADLLIYSDTTAEEIFDREYQAIKKALQRGRKAVPSKGVVEGTLLDERTGRSTASLFWSIENEHGA